MFSYSPFKPSILLQLKHPTIVYYFFINSSKKAPKKIQRNKKALNYFNHHLAENNGIQQFKAKTNSQHQNL